MIAPTTPRMVCELTPLPPSEPMLAALTLGNLSDGKHFRTKRESQEHFYDAVYIDAADTTLRLGASPTLPYPFPNLHAPAYVARNVKVSAGFSEDQRNDLPGSSR